MPDLGDLLSGFGKMQQAQASEYEGVAGGGVVRVKATGGMEFTAVEIDPEAVDPDDVEMLQDLVLAALHDLSTTIAEAQRDAIGGFDLGGARRQPRRPVRRAGPGLRPRRLREAATCTPHLSRS